MSALHAVDQTGRFASYLLDSGNEYNPGRIFFLGMNDDEEDVRKLDTHDYNSMGATAYLLRRDIVWRTARGTDPLGACQSRGHTVATDKPQLL